MELATLLEGWWPLWAPCVHGTDGNDVGNQYANLQILTIPSMTTKGGGSNSATSIRDYFSEDNECMNGGMEAWRYGDAI